MHVNMAHTHPRSLVPRFDACVNMYADDHYNSKWSPNWQRRGGLTHSESETSWHDLERSGELVGGVVRMRFAPPVWAHPREKKPDLNSGARSTRGP